MQKCFRHVIKNNVPLQFDSVPKLDGNNVPLQFDSIPKLDGINLPTKVVNFLLMERLYAHLPCTCIYPILSWTQE